MTEKEKLVVTMLAEAWNEFLLLPVEHNDETTEFRHAIHAAQSIVLSRSGRREYNESICNAR